MVVLIWFGGESGEVRFPIAPWQCFLAHIDSHGRLVMRFYLWLLGFSTEQLVFFSSHTYLNAACTQDGV